MLALFLCRVLSTLHHTPYTFNTIQGHFLEILRYAQDDGAGECSCRRNPLMLAYLLRA